MPDRTVSNSVVTYARGRATQIRNKQRFIPFGEYLPCRNILGKIEWINNAVPYDLTATPNRSEIIRIDGDGISPLICYEGIFWDDMCRYCRQGAEIFFISASNEIVDNMHCEKQMLNISRANAITTDRSIVRAVQNGLSYAVDNRGRVLAFCDNADTRVIDSRPTDEGQVIRRRRACDSCKKRFTTYEKVEEIMFMVVKKDGSRELFNRSKVRNGIVNACKKRPITTEQIEKIVDDIERGLNNMMEKEISSTVIGEVILDNLKELDEVAYVRFASVYRQFEDVDTFMKEIEKLNRKKN